MVWYLLLDPEEEMTIARVDQPIPGSQVTIVLSLSLSLNRKGGEDRLTRMVLKQEFYL